MRIEERARIGMVGDNGAGKTTLIRILAGVDDPDRGQVHLRRDLRIAYMAQIPAMEPGTTVFRYVERGTGEFEELAQRISEIEHRLAEAPDDEAAVAAWGRLHSAFEAGGGYDRVHLCERVLAGIGIPETDWQKELSVLSGGEKSRVALATLMTQPADLLILDEPTNHLDLQGIEYLEGFVTSHPGAVVVVSHDRAFLDAVASEIVEIDGGKATRYPGNYKAYAEQRDRALLAAARAFKNQQEYIDKEMDFIRRNMAGRMSTQAKGRLKRLQRVERMNAPKRDGSAMRLTFRGGKGMAGQAVFEVDDLAARLPSGRVLFEHATFKIFHGEVIGIVGRNGAGKTTLLQILSGRRRADAGSVNVSRGVRIGFFSQEMQDLPTSGTVLDALRQVDVKATERDLRDHLALFLFTGDDIDHPIAGLSGGEKRRLCLARLTRSDHDVLCLDEPTNHLDVTTREGLEQAVQSFPGTTILVSHDRSFLRATADRVLYVADEAVRVFDGGLDACLSAIASEARERRADGAAAKAKQRADDPQPERAKSAEGRIRNPFQFQKLEERIFALEERVAALRADMERPENYVDASRMKELQKQEADVQAELADCYAKWENWA